ncbi:hypothetical protein T265_07471 [Opisthorchis viverrini]|uniref:Uncharacterized protein n=1 Tax=Opisthorchis viverrini TaxID=6198 RepID=A0A074ZH04_OPIVI|nr:hypothetical protein T265_07471 [Opisthorchis viverrini]KER24962.1 hypothetical protein T265_07471 [Opisthorchis viverrini]
MRKDEASSSHRSVNFGQMIKSAVLYSPELIGQPCYDSVNESRLCKSTDYLKDTTKTPSTPRITGALVEEPFWDLLELGGSTCDTLRKLGMVNFPKMRD